MCTATETTKRKLAKPKKPSPQHFYEGHSPRILFAGVAEGFRRQPAELLYVGSIPTPGSKTEISCSFQINAGYRNVCQKNASGIGSE